MKRDINKFALEFSQLCKQHNVYPVGGQDGEIYLGREEETGTGFYLSWFNNADELITGRLRCVVPELHETAMGNVTTVRPAIKLLE